MGNGYWETVLRIDLSEKSVKKDHVGERIWKNVLGGSGYGAKVLYDEVGADVDPFSPENKVVFALGPFQATKETGAAKFIAVTKSPLTGIFGETAAGADWGIELKKAGYDALIIQGKSEKPVYVWINDDSIEIRDGKKLWGLDSYETIDAIHMELEDEKTSIASIGQAGENLVAFACISVDKHSFGGRCGIGAIMGSKNLKAIVVRGSKSVSLYDNDKLSELTNKIGKKVLENTRDWLKKDGTASIMVGSMEDGDAPIKYWSADVWAEGAKKIGAPNFTKELNARANPCRYCVVGCHRHVKFNEPAEYAIEGAGPEYESLGMLGSCCLMDDVKALAKMNDLCNRYGLDTISTGAFIGFTMECFEKGILTEKDTDGLEVNWGDRSIMISLIHKIAKRIQEPSFPLQLIMQLVPLVLIMKGEIPKLLLPAFYFPKLG